MKKKHIMRIATIIIAVNLFIMDHSLAQNIITGTDKSDNYIQHRVMKKGDLFLFTNQNTNKRNDIAQYDNINKTGDFPSFKMTYTEKKQEIFFFRLRHPLAIEPYTEYELSFKYQASDMKGEGPYLEITAYDETRETQVESYRITIPGNEREWKQQVLRFTTKNKARFARLQVKSNSGGSGNILVGDVTLKQVSGPQAAKPKGIKVWNKSAWKLTSNSSFASQIIKLPGERNYYSLSLTIKWDEFAGTIPLKVEWMAVEKGKPLVTETIEMNDIEGVQAQWNGVQSDWKREKGSPIDFLSWQKNKLFNGNAKGGSGEFIFKMDKPEGAGFMRVRVDQARVIKGTFEMQNVEMNAEY